MAGQQGATAEVFFAEEVPAIADAILEATEAHAVDVKAHGEYDMAHGEYDMVIRFVGRYDDIAGWPLHDPHDADSGPLFLVACNRQADWALLLTPDEGGADDLERRLIRDVVGPDGGTYEIVHPDDDNPFAAQWARDAAWIASARKIRITVEMHVDRADAVDGGEIVSAVERALDGAGFRYSTLHAEEVL